MAEPTTTDRILDFGQVFGRWEITRTTADTNGELLEVRVEAMPGNGPPLHVHDHAEESYEVLSGEMEVCVNGAWRTLAPGQKVTVPRGVPHTLRNSAPVTLVNIHQPALDFERFFRRFHRLTTEAGVTVPPRSLRSAILVGMLFTEHAHENVTVKPPQAVMRALAALGRLLGYRLPE